MMNRKWALAAMMALMMSAWLCACALADALTLPEGLKVIEAEAFMGDMSVTEVVIPEGVEEIGARAFYGCEGMLQVTIPESVEKIGDAAFDGCEDLSVNAVEGSFAYNWAVDKGLIALEETPASSFIYSISNGQVTITDFIGTETKIVIPEMIEGYPVTAIGNNALQFSYDVTSVAIPEGVASIGTYAFYRCDSLASIVIPDGVTSIGKCTFYKCGSLKSVALPAGLKTIGDTAFADCTSLTSIVIPEGVTSIGINAFKGCTSLTSAEIPKGVTTIDTYAFWGCSSLKSIAVPDGVTSLKGVFYGCSSLTSAVIPEGIASIDGTFGGCSSLTSIVIPESVTSIKNSAFSDCISLTSLTIPKGVTEISGSAFLNCDGLTSVVIPEGVTSIGSRAFEGCSSLMSVVIPEGVKSIGDYAFQSCGKLTNLVIPEGVTSIGSYAFWWCSSLTSIRIPASVENIANTAFSGNGLTIYGEEGSYAETYADTKGIAFCSAKVPVISLVTDVSANTNNQTVIKVLAEVEGGNAPYTYQYCLYRDGALIGKTKYLDDAEFTCSVVADGSHQVEVFVKDSVGMVCSARIPELVVSAVGGRFFENTNGTAEIEVEKSNAIKNISALVEFGSLAGVDGSVVDQLFDELYPIINMADAFADITLDKYTEGSMTDAVIESIILTLTDPWGTALDTPANQKKEMAQDILMESMIDGSCPDLEAAAALDIISLISTQADVYEEAIDWIWFSGSNSQFRTQMMDAVDDLAEHYGYIYRTNVKIFYDCDGYNELAEFASAEKLTDPEAVQEFIDKSVDTWVENGTAIRKNGEVLFIKNLDGTSIAEEDTYKYMMGIKEQSQKAEGFSKKVDGVFKVVGFALKIWELGTEFNQNTERLKSILDNCGKNAPYLAALNALMPNMEGFTPSIAMLKEEVDKGFDNCANNLAWDALKRSMTETLAEEAVDKMIDAANASIAGSILLGGQIANYIPIVQGATTLIDSQRQIISYVELREEAKAALQLAHRTESPYTYYAMELCIATRLKGLDIAADYFSTCIGNAGNDMDKIEKATKVLNKIAQDKADLIELRGRLNAALNQL